MSKDLLENKPEKKYRLDMKEGLFNKILDYSTSKSLGGRTKGERILIAVNEMYDLCNTSIENTIILSDENRKVLTSFQNFNLLSNESLEEAINEALKVYIKEHKEELQNKIGEL